MVLTQFSGNYTAFVQIGGKVYWRSTDPLPTWQNSGHGIKELPSSILQSKFRTLVQSKLYQEADELLAEIEQQEKSDQTLRDANYPITDK